MKSLIEAVAIAALITAPLAAFAQSDQPVTRAQVRAELVQLEKAGYNPAIANDDDYPANIQAAEARVAAQNGKAQTSGYGSATNGSSQAGARTEAAPSSYSPPVVYVGH
ncbi:DUF4148 domain-containing protein [Paraburkholderia sp. 22099]|jgi:hypothetical protein|uniref:DUF4148 domain-containing protein n=2 Tax=Burkholderiaceae TaxID=119060 RepID=A0A1M6RZH3_9BURK|nr:MULTISPECIES: DUF4148 domain-containing protein [Paraburkholderia]MDR6491410.1 hypothetical protein [Paraburkholderia terricola]SDO54323.1 protein of unknown function [Paraburkholderia sediminicola]SHK37709.1 protein of unknown function [Paraburkholderia terricola]